MKKPIEVVVEEPPEEVVDPVSAEFFSEFKMFLIPHTKDNQEESRKWPCDPKGFPRLRGGQSFSGSWFI